MIGKRLYKEEQRTFLQYNWIPFSIKYIFQAADTILPSVYLQEKDGLNRRNRWKCIANNHILWNYINIGQLLVWLKDV